MSISLSMPISCSLEMPNSAAKSWIRVVATSILAVCCLASAICRQPACQGRICDADRLDGRPAESRSQLLCCRPPQHRDAPGDGEPLHFFDGALARSEEHTSELQS